MSSIYKQIEYETEWLSFLNLNIIFFNPINVIDNEISSKYSKEFQSFILKKVKHYIKQNFSSWKCIQVSTTYSTCICNTDRDLFKKDVMCLVNQFFTWKKKEDDEISVESKNLMKEIEKEIFQENLKKKEEDENLKSLQKRINALCK